jgi:hypothetical protein
MKKKQNNLKTARQSLAQIMQEIAPYLPKTPQVKAEKPKTWKIVSNGTLPPLNSLPSN